MIDNDWLSTTLDTLSPPLTLHGFLGKRPSHLRSCIIIASHWPSWVFVIGALHLHCVGIYTTILQDPHISSLRQVYNQYQWFHISNLPSLPHLSTDLIVLIQGDIGTSLSSFLPLLYHTHHLLYVSSSHQDSIPPLNLSLVGSLCHFEAGGVTNSSWSLWSNRSFVLCQPCYILRSVRTIVDQTTPTLGCPIVSHLHDDISTYTSPHLIHFNQSQPVYNWNGLLPHNTPSTAIFCVRSIYGGDSWVHRPLTTSELARAYDIPSNLTPSLAGLSPQHLPFLRAAPSKVLLLFGSQALSLSGGAAWSSAITPRVNLELSTHLPGSPTNESCEQAIEESPRENLARQEEKATRADDVAIPYHLWDDRVWSLGLHSCVSVARFQQKFSSNELFFKRHQLDVPCPLHILRHWVMGRWQRNIYSDLLDFLRTRISEGWQDWDEKETLESARDVLQRVCHATFWEWKDGSALIFWRWPLNQQKIAMSGHPIWVKSPLPNWRRPQRQEKDDTIKGQVCKKLQLVRSRRYVSPGQVVSLTSYFSVPKGEGDIRMVYDATKSGLNSCLWVPSFALPGAEVLIRAMDENSWMGDLDLGDMFLNFPLDRNLVPYCGIDLKPYMPEVQSWERWTRCMMGLKPSPYVTIKAYHLAHELILGDRKDPKNVYHWTQVILNMPGQDAYNPMKPRLWKLNPITGKMASATLVYVDDLRSLSSSFSECWRVMHVTSTVLSYLGIQVAARKTRPPAMRPGPWAGAVAWSGAEGICVRCTKEKWSKTKQLVSMLQAELERFESGQCAAGLNFKQLERTRGFLVHMQRTYPALTPYLKGLHLTLDSWRPGRDPEGWKNSALISDYGFWNDNLGDWLPWANAPIDHPEFIKPVPRLRADLEALSQLLLGENPPLRFVRQKKVHTVVYGFADASGVGFGSSYQLPNGVAYSYGIWGRDADSDSSNFRELGNLVNSLEHYVSEGVLEGCEVFLFTDNSTAESVFYKGNTPSKTLFSLVLRLRQLEMNGSLALQVIHVAGTRMIQQGTDGLSRGDLTEGIMAGYEMRCFVPIHLCALDRQPSILHWVRVWTGQHDLTPLTTEEWFDRGHGYVTGKHDRRGLWLPRESGETWLLWSPPPAVADVAIDELMLSRHKRTHINHVFIAPRLCTNTWRKKLYKVCDLVFEVPAGSRPFWPPSEHEPLLIGLTLRFIACSPWQLRQTGTILELGRLLRSVWKAPAGSEWTILRQLSSLPETLESM